MRVTQQTVRRLKKGDKIWKSNANFTHTPIIHTVFNGRIKTLNDRINIKGSYSKEPLTVYSIEKNKDSNNYFIATTIGKETINNEYHIDDSKRESGNGIFTTLEEAIRFSKKELGVLDSNSGKTLKINKN